MDERFALARQVGQVEGRVAALEHKTDALEQRIDGRLAAIEGKIDQLTAVLNLGRGGWKALAVVGTLIIALATLTGWVVDHFLTSLRP